MKPSKKVLVADDDAAIRASIKSHLTYWGYDVREAVDGVQAIEEVSKDDFDLVICDGMMPNKTGWDVLREVKSNPRTRDVPVIVMVAKKDEPDIFRGYELGAEYYMSKPFTKSQLLDVIRFMLDEGGKTMIQRRNSN